MFLNRLAGLFRRSSADKREEKCFCLRDACTEETRKYHGDIRIGRGANNDLNVPDPLAAQRHARILLHEGKWQLMDTHSTNGTLLNGKSIPAGQPCPLSDGDTITFAPSAVFTFRAKA